MKVERRLAGAVLGAAIGDALGYPVEFLRSFEAIRAEYGPAGVRDLVLSLDQGGRRVAGISDDTQMAMVVLRTLIAARRSDLDLEASMVLMARGFVDWAHDPPGGHRAPGRACLAGCRALAQGTPWREAGGETAGGCGSVMRAYPFGLAFHGDLERAERWAVEHSRMTHRDPIALAACAGMAVAMALLVQGKSLEEAVAGMIEAAGRHSPGTADMIRVAVDEARQGVAPEVALQRLQGWAAHECIAAAAYVVTRHPGDPEAGLLEGANTPGDSDSIATLVGALLGARHGLEAIPERWVRGVEWSQELLSLAGELGALPP